MTSTTPLLNGIPTVTLSVLCNTAPSAELLRAALAGLPTAALNAGASVCVRGAEAPVVAAYLQPVARRQGLLTDGSVR